VETAPAVAAAPQLEIAPVRVHRQAAAVVAVALVVPAVVMAGVQVPEVGKAGDPVLVVARVVADVARLLVPSVAEAVSSAVASRASSAAKSSTTLRRQRLAECRFHAVVGRPSVFLAVLR